MPSSRENCSQCGMPLNPAALSGLCPRCVALDFLTPSPDSKLEIKMPGLEDDSRRLGDYELLEEISRGGMGIVYLARQVSLGRNVAVKMILQGVLAGDTAIERFKAEAAAAALLNHPNIVAIHEIGEDQGRLFFSMEYITGRTLADMLRDGPLAARVAAGFMQTIATAVDYAHEQGVLHRDLKPSNILIDAEGRPRVTDFGLAKRFDHQSDLTLTGQVLGTPAYIPPEQAGWGANAKVDARSDVYALGAVLYHAICGFAPFSGESVTEILHKVTGFEPIPPRLLNPGLPRDLETICLKCLAKEPSRRYASARELAEDIGRFLGNEPIHARPVGAVEKLWRWSRRQPALAAALVACAVILAGGIGGILWELRETNTAKAVAVEKAHDEEKQRIAAENSELVMRQNLYTADMLAVQRALDLNDLGSARLLLNNHRPVGGQTDLRGFEWRYLWSRARGDAVMVLTNGNRCVNSLAFSPDGKWLGFAGDRIQMCDSSSFQVSAEVGETNVISMAFYPDSASVLLGCSDPWTVRRWDWKHGGQPTNFIDPHGAWPRVSISPRGDIIAVGCGNDILSSEPEGVTTLYDASTGEIRRILPASGGQAAFSPDGKLIATGTGGGKVKLWNPISGDLVRELTNSARVRTIAFSPDGQTLAVCAPMADGATCLYDIATGAQRPFARGNFCCVWGAAFSPDGSTLATAITDETVRLWDIKSRKQTGRFLGHSYQVACVAWSPDGKVLASGGADGTVRLWDVAGAKEEEVTIPGEVQSRMFSSDGKLVAITEGNGAVCIRELPSLRVAMEARQIGTPLGFLPDVTAFLSMRWPTNTETSEVLWWTIPDFKLAKKITLREAGLETFVQQLSPDARLLACGGSHGSLRVFDLADNGKLRAQVTLPDDGDVSRLTFSPDGQRLGAAFLQSTAGYLWDMKPDHRPLELKGLHGLVFLFSRDGNTVFGTGEKGLTYWKAASGEEIAHVLGRWGGVDRLDVSRDGKTLAFPARGAIRFWNVATRREVARLETHSQGIGVAFAPDGNTLFISEDTTNGPVTIVKHAPGFEQTDTGL